MFKSFKIGKWFDIPIYLHWSFILLPVLVFYRHDFVFSSALLWEILLVFSLFGCVLLHEFGHALSARRYGVHTVDIILSVIGGVARLRSLPKRPVQELIVAAAGPAVNVVIATFITLFLWLTDQLYLPVQPEIGGINFLFYLGSANIFLVIFNLIPAFPMDGGRMLRALLAMRLPYNTATRIAVYVGYLLAAIFVAAGFYYEDYTLVFIAVFVFSSGTSEYRATIAQNAVKINEIMQSEFTVLQQNTTVEQALFIAEQTAQAHFVVLNLLQPVGIISKAQLAAAESAQQVAALMNPQFHTLSPETVIPADQLDRLLKTAKYLPIIPVLKDNIVVGVVA